MHPVQSAFDIWQSNFKVKILLAIQKAIQNGILFDCNVIGGNHQFDHNALFQNLIDSGNFSTRIEIFENLKRYYLDWNNAPYNFKPELLFRYHTRYQKEIGSIVLDKSGINDPIFEGTLCQMALQRYYNKITNFFIVINWNVQSCWKVSPHIFYDRNFASRFGVGKLKENKSGITMKHIKFNPKVENTKEPIDNLPLWKKYSFISGEDLLKFYENQQNNGDIS